MAVISMIRGKLCPSNHYLFIIIAIIHVHSYFTMKGTQRPAAENIRNIVVFAYHMKGYEKSNNISQVCHRSWPGVGTVKTPLALIHRCVKKLCRVDYLCESLPFPKMNAILVIKMCESKSD